MSTTLHVHPRTDLINHDTTTDQADCICGPRVQPIQHDDGSMGWVIVHHPLDSDTHST